MDILLVKNLSDCLQTAHEIQEHLVHGNLAKGLALARTLIDKLEDCVRSAIRDP